MIFALFSREIARVKRRALAKVVLLLAALAVLSGACAGERRVHPPPEGEWLEWEPKGTTKRSEATPAPKPEAKPAVESKSAKEDVEDLDAPPAKSASSSEPTVKCNGRDLTRESWCAALSELGTKQCPDKMPPRSDAKEAGNFEEPPKGAKRDPSLEASSKQCCFAWCAKVPAAAPPVPCDSPSPAFCFEAPPSTKQSAPPPYAECPMGLAKTGAKGRRKATPKAVFSSKLTKAERSGEPHTCCYEACK